MLQNHLRLPPQKLLVLRRQLQRRRLSSHRSLLLELPLVGLLQELLAQSGQHRSVPGLGGLDLLAAQRNLQPSEAAIIGDSKGSFFASIPVRLVLKHAATSAAMTLDLKLQAVRHAGYLQRVIPVGTSQLWESVEVM